MASSNPPASALALFLGLLLVAGCAHAGAAAHPGAGAPARPRSTASGGGAPSTGAAPAAGAPGAPARLDPSEEITAGELASIPEPVPVPVGGRRAPSATAPSSGDSTRPPSAAMKGLPEAAEPRSAVDRGSPPAAPTNAAQAGEWTWRVQILATPDRALAERVAKEAEERLGTVSRLDVESGLFKVRLGGFAGEADAQVLKQRAVEMGYPGAFRVKIRASRTDE